MGNSETKEKSKRKRERNWWGEEKEGKKVNDNRKTDSFFSVFTISVYRALLMKGINTREAIFLSCKTTTVYKLLPYTASK